jgi:hypothetical protein
LLSREMLNNTFLHARENTDQKRSPAVFSGAHHPS